jgi:hypothetical protein
MGDGGQGPRPLTRCFRGHSTPAGKTFCDSCGARLDDSTGGAGGGDGGDGDGGVVKVPNRRRHPRLPGDVVPATSGRRRRFPRR